MKAPARLAVPGRGEWDTCPTDGKAGFPAPVRRLALDEAGAPAGMDDATDGCQPSGPANAPARVGDRLGEVHLPRRSGADRRAGIVRSLDRSLVLPGRELDFDDRPAPVSEQTSESTGFVEY